MELLPDIPGVHNCFKFKISFFFNWDMMKYVIEIWKKSWKCTVKQKSNLVFPIKLLHILSQTNVFIGFYNKKREKLFETYTYKIKFKKYIFSSKWLRWVWAFMELTVLKLIWFFVQHVWCGFWRKFHSNEAIFKLRKKLAKWSVVKTTRRT